MKGSEPPPESLWGLGTNALVAPESVVELLESQRKEAPATLDFESAAALRDQLLEVKARGSPAAHVRGEGLSRIRAPR